jgi:DNA-binding response OmpR family regulator
LNKLLIIEDDVKIAALLQTYMMKYDLKAWMANDFSRIIDTFEKVQPDLVLMDINLPKFDGYYWCRKIRERSLCPIIFLSARDGELDQVMALENGGDDYITKPFSYQIVIAKVRAQLRRAVGDFARNDREPVYRANGLTFHPLRLTICKEDHKAELTKNETKFLELIWRSAPAVATREALLEEIWDDATFVDDNTLSVTVARLRKKLDLIGAAGAIRSIRGSGYRWAYQGEGS